MSPLEPNADFIVALNNASSLINRYLSIFIYIFGTIGNLLNVLVLTQRSLRSNPSAISLLVSSMAGFIVILSGLTSRMMSGYAADLTLTIGWICKLRNLVLYSGRTVLLWMIVLATVDRWLSSSADVHIRQMSNVKNVQRSMLVVLLYTCIINVPIIFCYEANVIGSVRGCYGSTNAHRLTTDLIYAFGTTLLPLLLMIIFGLLTIRNVRHMLRRVQNVTESVLGCSNTNKSTNTSGQQHNKKRDRQLLKMLLVQVALLFLFTGPHAIQKVYSLFTITPPDQPLQAAISDFIFNLFTLLTFIASGMPFYIYTLTGGRVFQNALFHLMKTIARKTLCR